MARSTRKAHKFRRGECRAARSRAAPRAAARRDAAPPAGASPAEYANSSAIHCDSHLSAPAPPRPAPSTTLIADDITTPINSTRQTRAHLFLSVISILKCDLISYSYISRTAERTLMLVLDIFGDDYSIHIIVVVTNIARVESTPFFHAEGAAVASCL